ncbi:TD and POZ domain-containing protein 5 [Eumeta japonica]|uniref:TD and POZ domain-containing protein 5 n=1 Tax=Eumeta variegata TaxID=151549 RepID=A0A4C1T266_EUMVA|nr:TD and POZ domain-containing protein 5 [Eumeta japonica]
MAENDFDDEIFARHRHMIPDFVMPRREGAGRGRIIRGHGHHRRPQPRRQPRNERTSEDFIIENDAVTTLNKCETENARKLYIFDIATKLRSPGTYDIGGTYAEHPEFWFLFKTSFCPGKNYLLSLFVCHRVPGPFYIGVSSTNSLTFRKATDVGEKSCLTSNLAWHMFKNEQKDTYFYIKTFCFSEDDIKSLEDKRLCIALRIKDKMPLKLLPDIIKKIKLQHDFGELLTKPDKTDFVLISSSGSKFPTHKIILVAHSPVLRELIKSTTSSSLELDITDEDMTVLLQFMYTGTIKDLASHDGTKLLNLAEKYGLKTMFALMQHTISTGAQSANIAVYDWYTGTPRHLSWSWRRAIGNHRRSSSHDRLCLFTTTQMSKTRVSYYL